MKPADTAAQLAARLTALRTGGCVRLEGGELRTDRTLTLAAPSARLTGETWAYASDPNGVFAPTGGALLHRTGNGFPILAVGAPDAVCGGVSAENLGFFGDIPGMDTRGLFDPRAEHPAPDAGLYFGAGRVDQGFFSRLSFGGLGAAVFADGSAELDACSFEHLNADGCACGVFFAPRASYYTHFSRCVIADNPYYGFFADGSGSVHNLEIADTLFVRCGGAFPANHPDAAAVFLRGIRHARVRGCLFDSPGTFWFYPDGARRNDARQPEKRRTAALRITGDGNIISDCVFRHSSGAAVEIRGSGNILRGIVSDGDVILHGAGNTVSDLVFTSPDARLLTD